MGIEYLIMLCLGVALGTVMRAIWDDRHKVNGTIQIDHNTGLCRFNINNEPLYDSKCKKVVFDVRHDATITDMEYDSQEKHRL